MQHKQFTGRGGIDYKKAKQFLIFCLLLGLVSGICACAGPGSGASSQAPAAAETESTAESLKVEESAKDQPQSSAKTAETEAADQTSAETQAQTEAATDADPTGVYTAFAMESQGYQVTLEGTDVESVLTLEEGGTGNMTFSGDAMNISSWTYEDGILSITMDDGSSAQGSLHGGIASINLGSDGSGSYLLHLAKEGADLTGFDLLTPEELQQKLAEEAAAGGDTRLYAAWAAMDQNAGVHMAYEMKTQTPEATTVYDVHVKNGIYYSRRTTQTSYGDSTTITFFQDGKAMNLYPEDMTGKVVTQTDSADVTQNILGMDSLYSAMSYRASQTSFIEETRDVDGKSYTVDVYPADDYHPETAFYFNEDGSLACCQQSAWTYNGTEMGEIFYTISSIDGSADESLFDISGYSIEE